MVYKLSYPDRPLSKKFNLVYECFLMNLNKLVLKNKNKRFNAHTCNRQFIHLKQRPGHISNQKKNLVRAQTFDFLAKPSDILPIKLSKLVEALQQYFFLCIQNEWILERGFYFVFHSQQWFGLVLGVLQCTNTI